MPIPVCLYAVQRRDGRFLGHSRRFGCNPLNMYFTSHLCLAERYLQDLIRSGDRTSSIVALPLGRPVVLTGCRLAAEAAVRPKEVD